MCAPRPSLAVFDTTHDQKMRSRKDLGTGLGYTFEQKRVLIKIRLPWGYFEGGSNLQHAIFHFRSKTEATRDTRPQ